MKIGFVFDDSLDQYDGVQQYILTLGRWMQTEGHDVHYLVGETKRTDLSNIHSLSRNIQVKFNHNRMSTPLPAKRSDIMALLKQEKFDVLHVQMPYSPVMAARVVSAAPASTAIVGTFHIVPYSWVEWVSSRMLGMFLRNNAKRFDAIFSVSKPAQEFAKHAFGVRSKVIPNVVDLPQYQKGKKLPIYKDKLTIVFLGRLVERKGCMHLLKALVKLNKRHKLSDVHVVVCGRGPMESELKKFTVDNNLESIVSFVGFIDEKDKPNYLASADIAVLPSTGGESFGIVLIEAMAAGSDVVIGGNNVGYRSVMGERPDQLVDPTNITEFARTLERFITAKEARKKAKSWQKKHVKQYDVAAVGGRLLDEYRKVIAKKSISDDNGSQ